MATWSPSGFRGFSSWLLGLTVSGPGVRQHITVGAQSQAGLLTSRAARKQRGGGMAPNNPLKDTHQCPHSLPWTPPQCSATSQQCTASQPGFECRHLSSPHCYQLFEYELLHGICVLRKHGFVFIILSVLLRLRRQGRR